MRPSLFFDPYGVLPRGESSGPASGASSDIAGKIRAIRSDPKHPYNDRRVAGHEAAVQEVAELCARLPLPETGLRDELDVAL